MSNASNKMKKSGSKKLGQFREFSSSILLTLSISNSYIKSTPCYLFLPIFSTQKKTFFFCAQQNFRLHTFMKVLVLEIKIHTNGKIFIFFLVLFLSIRPASTAVVLLLFSDKHYSINLFMYLSSYLIECFIINGYCYSNCYFLLLLLMPLMVDRKIGSGECFFFFHALVVIVVKCVKDMGDN